MSSITHYKNFFAGGRAFCGAEDAKDYALRPTCPACIEGLLALTEQRVACDQATCDALEYVGSDAERDRAAGNLYASQQALLAWQELRDKLQLLAERAA